MKGQPEGNQPKGRGDGTEMPIAGFWNYRRNLGLGAKIADKYYKKLEAKKRKERLNATWPLRMMSAQGLLLHRRCDEAGRGPLAGPVVAACVILPDTIIYGLNDSKVSPANGTNCMTR